jgi:DNA-binding PadR family transcriptional regulator
MPLPDITHLQFLILAILMNDEKTGRCVRKELAEQGVKKSGPAFYQLMARLEDSRFVKGWYEQKIVDGQIIKERRYKLTGQGRKAIEQVQEFYFANPRLELHAGGAHHA